MGMSVKWLDEDRTVIYHHLDFGWTAEEFSKSIEMITEMMVSVDSDVSLLVAMQGYLNELAYSEVSKVIRDVDVRLPSNLSQVITIGKSRYKQEVVAMLNQIGYMDGAISTRPVNTRDEAYIVLGIIPHMLMLA